MREAGASGASFFASLRAKGTVILFLLCDLGCCVVSHHSQNQTLLLASFATLVPVMPIALPVLLVIINDISYAERSVDERMQEEMKRGKVILYVQ